jgi:hypothetical protein
MCRFNLLSCQGLHSTGQDHLTIPGDIFYFLKLLGGRIRTKLLEETYNDTFEYKWQPHFLIWAAPKKTLPAGEWK